MAIHVHEVLTPVMRRFRERRLRRIVDALGMTAQSRVLDVGGLPAFWRYSPVRPRVTFFNRMAEPPPGLLSGDEYVQGDARAMTFADHEWEIVVSNSVIEHVGEMCDQERFAREVHRVGQRYAVQTPDFAFPLEPHVVGLGIHYLPRPWRPFLSRYLTLVGWGYFNRPEHVRHLIMDVRLLSYRDMQRLFPNAQIVRERLAGLSKSLLALRV